MGKYTPDQLRNTLMQAQQSLEQLNLYTNTECLSGTVSLDFSEIIDYCCFVEALTRCRRIAETEYSTIKGKVDQITQLQNNVQLLKNELGNIIIAPGFMSGNEYVSQQEDADKLNEALTRFSVYFQETLIKIQKKSTEMARDLKNFKVVLFGKTKAGKSTIREALTHGNGKTIGKGGQSTTTEIHRYNWYNLQICDTPGILSVRDKNRDSKGIGLEERQAADLLQRSDIALFMCTSDNIEKAELDYLRQITEQSKEVLVLLNVKADISNYRMFKIRKYDSKVTPEAQKEHIARIREVCPRGCKITVLPIHAQAAFYSRAKGNAEVDKFYKDNPEVTRDELYQLSHFGDVRNFLVENIRERGCQIRCETQWKYFIEQIRTFAKENRQPLESCRDRTERILEKIRRASQKIEGKIQQYENSLGSRVNSLARSCIDTQSIASYCITYRLSKERIESYWNSQLQKLKEIPDIIANEFHNEMNYITRELECQLNFEIQSSTSFSGFQDEEDLKKLFKLGGIAVTLAGTVMVFMFSNPIGWWLLGLGGLISLLTSIFTSRATKIYRLKEKMDSSLNECCNNLTKQIRGALRSQSFTCIRNIMNALWKSQENMLNICQRFLQLNDELIRQANQHEQYMKNRVKSLLNFK